MRANVSSNLRNPRFPVKARPLHHAGRRSRERRITRRGGAKRSFEELLRYYYSITPEDPPDLAKHWIARSLKDVEIARFTFQHYGMNGDCFLDLGCSTGAMLAAASSFCQEMTGVDVAFRWLVVGAARLRELGVSATLVCANAEFLPFSAESFDSISAIDLLEHLPQPLLAVKEAVRVSRPGAKSVYRINNRFALTPEPHIHMWGGRHASAPVAGPLCCGAAKGPACLPHRSSQQPRAENFMQACWIQFIDNLRSSAACAQFRGRFPQIAITVYNTALNSPLIGALLRLVGPLLVCVAKR